MRFFNFLKQIKKQLNRRRRWLTLAMWMIILLAITSTAGMPNLMISKTDVLPVYSAALVTDQPHVLERMKSQSRKQQVFLQKNYVCGEEINQLGQLLPSEIKKLHEANPQWKMTINSKEQIYFVETIEDLSPRCKENAYFGLDTKGNLSLFEGLPKKEQVIRTFFQMNIEHLKTSLPQETIEQLYEGIRINDLVEYNSVLSTFSDYAAEETEEVLKPSL